MRSFFEYPGFKLSNFAKILPDNPRFLTKRVNSTKGVFPIAATVDDKTELCVDAINP